ncbi:unnamed protein product [Macrosiphum euphorbiae]|uniref:THAP-type domain-containing protein n=1 Tax=Macrosiphum euphorbiae TaxID=13131 RepID=A0AAV0XVR7_9HEMI|nr:unnamed protein product [Macrosiphum euphorbiae]
MPSNNCAVIGCDTKYTDKHIIRHRFPKDEETCGVWVQKSGNNNLLNKSPLQIFNYYIICEKHFDASCSTPGFKKLIRGSIPTLNLPGYSSGYSLAKKKKSN